MTPTSTTAARYGRSEGEGEGEKERHRGGEIRHSPMMYGQQKSESQRNCAGTQSRAFPVTAAVGLAEREERSGEGGSG